MARPAGFEPRIDKIQLQKRYSSPGIPSASQPVTSENEGAVRPSVREGDQIVIGRTTFGSPDATFGVARPARVLRVEVG